MSSLPFLVVLDVCTTLARFDLGIVLVVKKAFYGGGGFVTEGGFFLNL